MILTRDHFLCKFWHACHHYHGQCLLRTWQTHVGWICGMCVFLVSILQVSVYYFISFIHNVWYAFFFPTWKKFCSCIMLKYMQMIMLVVYAGCKDIDDALHCTTLQNGNFEVGVRILQPVNWAFCWKVYYNWKVDSWFLVEVQSGFIISSWRRDAFFYLFL